MKKKSQTQGYADLMLKSAKKEISPAIPSLNVALLRKVQNHILEEPRRLMMSLLAIKQGEQAPYYAKDLPETFGMNDRKVEQEVLGIIDKRRICKRCRKNEVYLDIKTMDLCEACIWKLVREEQ